jgi:hypothetical protein
MIHYVVYDVASGALKRSGACAPEVLQMQAGVVQSSGETLIVAQVNLGPVREHLRRKVDTDAEAFRLQFITPGAGQAVTYMRKENEALAYLANSAAAAPLLSAEAAATGKTVAALAAEVMIAVGQWTVIGAKIEAARMAAKKTIAEAASLPAMHVAANINWAAVVA